MVGILLMVIGAGVLTLIITIEGAHRKEPWVPEIRIEIENGKADTTYIYKL